MPRTLEHDPRDAQPELFDDDVAPRGGARKMEDADADGGDLASVSRWLARDPEEEALDDADILETRELDDEEDDLRRPARDLDEDPYDAYETSEPDA